MLIYGIDAAVRTGLCIGRSDSRSNRPDVWTGAFRLKRPDDHYTIAWNNAGFLLRDRFVLEKPDMVAIEAPLTPNAHRSADAIIIQWGIVAVMTFVAKAYNVRVEYVNTLTVAKHFVGSGDWTKAAGGRRAKKLATLKRAKLLGYLPQDSTDEDVADACAVFDFAAHKWGRASSARFEMFDQRGQY